MIEQAREVELFIDDRGEKGRLLASLRAVTGDCGCQLRLHNLQSTEGKARAERLEIDRAPAVAVDGELIFQGDPEGEAEAVLSDETCVYDLFD